MITLAKEALKAGNDRESLQKLVSGITGDEINASSKRIMYDHILGLVSRGQMPQVDLFDAQGKRIGHMDLKTNVSDEEMKAYDAEFKGKVNQLEKDGTKVAHIRFVFTDNGISADESGGYIHLLDNGTLITRILTTEVSRAMKKLKASGQSNLEIKESSRKKQAASPMKKLICM